MDVWKCTCQLEISTTVRKMFTIDQIKAYCTWFSVAPLWRWVVRRLWGPLLLHRTRPSLPETSWSMLPDDILKIIPENINDRQQLMHFTVQSHYVHPSVSHSFINFTSVYTVFMWHCTWCQAALCVVPRHHLFGLPYPDHSWWPPPGKTDRL